MTATTNLYARHRPRRFDQLIGQKEALGLRDAVRDNRVCQTYLFHGPRGCGKTSAARILAGALNCLNHTLGEPCGECWQCRNIHEQDVPLSGFVELSAAVHGDLDSIIELRSGFDLGSPSKRKVYLIDEAHQLSVSAQNALLKDIEEPPHHVVFIFATTEPDRLIDPLVSRCFQVRFGLLPVARMREMIGRVAEHEGIALDGDRLDELVRVGEGSPRDALSALDVAGHGFGDDMGAASTQIVTAMAAGNLGGVLVSCREAASNAALSARRVIELAQTFWIDALLHDRCPNEVRVPESLRRFLPSASATGTTQITANVRLLAETAARLRGDSSATLEMESALVQVMCHGEADRIDVLSDKLDRVLHHLRLSDTSQGVSACD